ncbi:hypothetical protein JCM10207_003379 [Rhodosporidiobolus poonsookiae]
MVVGKTDTVPARTFKTLDGYEQRSAADGKEHYTAIVMGAGLSGMAAAIQLKRRLGLEDVLVLEKDNDVGGTWSANRYPGAACDIPLTLYSFSFAPAYGVNPWASQADIIKYLHRVQRQFNLNNVVFRSAVESCTFSRSTGLWTVTVRDLETDRVRTRTCNILVSCLGGLAIPNDPPFDPKDFDGEVFHSAQWPKDLDLNGKRLVVVGNGCSAAQIIPEVIKTAGQVTQIARARQSFLRRPVTPDSWLMRWMTRWIPGFGFLLRAAMFFILEGMFKLSDIKHGVKARTTAVKGLKEYVRDSAPEKYWNDLEPNFDIAAKRRVFDTHYYKALHAPNMELVADDSVERVQGDKVFTRNGKVVEADVIALATGFKVRDYLFPVKVVNDKGVNLQDCLMANKVKTYQSTLVADFPNFFWVMGPNSATGHSSVLFTSEAQISLMSHLIRPVLSALRAQPPSQPLKPAPYVEVTQEAEDDFYDALRREMKKRVWEKDGGVSWYVDKDTGLCTALYPWSQVHFWRQCTYPRYSDFKWTNASRPWAWRSYLGFW